MFVDASVIIAILTEEKDAEGYAQILDTNREFANVTSVLASWEATVGLFRKTGKSMDEAKAIVQDFLEIAGIIVLSIGAEEEALALDVFQRNGRHRFGEGERNLALNMADCFHYAVAKLNKVPILTMDIGFEATDVQVVRIA